MPHIPHILVVDDSRLSRRLVVDTLRDAGHRVTEAENGAVALELFCQDQPDCVVTDLLMPVMDGHELLRQLRAVDSDVPVVVATADIQTPSRNACEELGISGFLNKPVQPDELSAVVNAALTQTTGARDNDAQ